ncbi:MAG: thioredoxin domain-containing protein [Balneolaceae bacterium]
MKKLFLSQFLIGMLAFGFACEKAPENRSATTNSSQTASSIVEQPNADVKVTLVKYSDYQCPACKYFVPFEHQLKEDFGGEINIVVKNFPLSMHPYAHVAARSAEAARKQGKYQEMHDMIFDGQETWSRGNAEAIFVGYARSLNMNVEQFQQDMNSADMNRIVMNDRREGRELGVNSTPTFYINGDLIEENPGTYPAFKALVEEYMD